MNPKVQLAALNNAHLYQGVCRAHGIETELTSDSLTVLGSPPRFFSNLVTLDPSFQPAAVRTPWGIKDSFSTCGVPGATLLFEADWILGSPRKATPLLEWHPVRTDQQLEYWLEGWSHGDAEATSHPRQFPDSMLSDSEFQFWSAYDGPALVGGCVLNQSPGAIGVSNVFSRLNESNLYPDLIGLAYDWCHESPVVGYERGDALKQAIKAGFAPIGKLRVLVM
jgi:hypothetical protein